MGPITVPDAGCNLVRTMSLKFWSPIVCPSVFQLIVGEVPDTLWLSVLIPELSITACGGLSPDANRQAVLNVDGGQF